MTNNSSHAAEHYQDKHFTTFTNDLDLITLNLCSATNLEGKRLILADVKMQEKKRQWH